MAYFLAKTDPETYSIDDLERDGVTTWDGVRNAQAIGVIRAMTVSDTVLIYHSMGQAAIVGVAEVVSDPRPDLHVARSWTVDVRFVRRLPAPVTLREIKETGRFEDWSLIRQSRLSTMAVPEAFMTWLRERGVQLH